MESSNELVLRPADDLDYLAGALGFGVQYALNAGFPVIDMPIPTLGDALRKLTEDAAALSEMLETR